MKILCALLLAAVATPVMTTGAKSAPIVNPNLRTSVSDPSPASESGDADLHPPDPQKELRHLSKDLKLKRNQRVGVSSILQERSREIHLLLDIQSLSPEYREKFAAQVMAQSNAQIEALLRSKQKRKFDRELAKERVVR